MDNFCSFHLDLMCEWGIASYYSCSEKAVFFLMDSDKRLETDFQSSETK